jgi:hypothetical protein
VQSSGPANPRQCKNACTLPLPSGLLPRVSNTCSPPLRTAGRPPLRGCTPSGTPSTWPWPLPRSRAARPRASCCRAATRPPFRARARAASPTRPRFTRTAAPCAPLRARAARARCRRATSPALRPSRGARGAAARISPRAERPGRAAATRLARGAPAGSCARGPRRRDLRVSPGAPSAPRALRAARPPRRAPSAPRTRRLKPAVLPGTHVAHPDEGGSTHAIPHTATPPNANGPPQGGPFSTSNRRRPTLPGSCEPSTIGAEGLNCSVRNGKRCFPLAMATGKRRKTTPSGGPSKPHSATRASNRKNRQALGPLVPVSFARRRASRSGLSTWWSTRVLTPSRGWESSSRGRLPA